MQIYKTFLVLVLVLLLLLSLSLSLSLSDIRNKEIGESSGHQQKKNIPV
jgi:hypothetical protein